MDETRSDVAGRRGSSLRPIACGRLAPTIPSMIEIDHVTKRYGEEGCRRGPELHRQAGNRDRLSGPQRGGKSTNDASHPRARTRPNIRNTTVNGKPYADLPAPLHEIGALLEARAIHTGRSA